MMEVAQKSHFYAVIILELLAAKTDLTCHLLSFCDKGFAAALNVRANLAWRKCQGCLPTKRGVAPA